MPELDRKQALVVDADPQIDMAVMAVLSPEEWHVVHVQDNAAALEWAGTKRIDLVITGPSTSGKQDVTLLRAIRRIQPDVRVIILTDRSTPADVIASMRERAFAYFTTPFTPEVFEHMVRNAMADGWEDGVKVVSATPEWICLLVRCDLQSADRLMQFMKEIACLPPEELQPVGIAFREMLMNAIRYGGKFDPDKYVEISYVKARHAVACKVKDPGVGFALDELYHAAVANPADNPLRHLNYREAAGLPAGGYGILLTRHMVDELIYNEQGNEVLLIKYLDQEDPAAKQVRQGPILPL